MFQIINIELVTNASLRSAQESGIWAWDCVLMERILVIPFVLGLLGDNPMQSEFACHIGLTGKFFCRICEVWSRNWSKKKTSTAEGVGGDSGSEKSAQTDAGVGTEQGGREEVTEMLERFKRAGKVSSTWHFI